MSLAQIYSNDNANDSQDEFERGENEVPEDNEQEDIADKYFDVVEDDGLDDDNSHDEEDGSVTYGENLSDEDVAGFDDEHEIDEGEDGDNEDRRCDVRFLLT